MAISHSELFDELITLHKITYYQFYRHVIWFWNQLQSVKDIRSNSQQTRRSHPKLVECWANIKPTLGQRVVSA